jgi:dTDP-4-amino-4,6-dideoxygalactose transaminase
MGGLEGASLNIKLKYLENWNNRRRVIAKRYLNEIKNSKIKMQKQPDFADSIFHLFVVTTENKDSFVKHLADNGIAAAFHYPVPCHLQKAYSNLGYKQGDFPNSEYLAAHCVSLPMFAELTDDEVNKVIEVVNSY